MTLSWSCLVRYCLSSSNEKGMQYLPGKRAPVRNRDPGHSSSSSLKMQPTDQMSMALEYGSCRMTSGARYQRVTTYLVIWCFSGGGATAFFSATVSATPSAVALITSSSFSYSDPARASLALSGSDASGSVAETVRASPKSQSLSCPDEEMRMLAGFRSRWIPRSMCTCASAASICARLKTALRFPSRDGSLSLAPCTPGAGARASWRNLRMQPALPSSK
mmetsp:Transcript_39833/g.83539  ORF Transcript_39833/g.83539 Transcript_39833/m.83539 type:complete len:220 (+) Transcript_39833:919-1578(+)